MPLLLLLEETAEVIPVAPAPITGSGVALSPAAPIPTGTPSHLGDLFSRMYGSYAQDPLPTPAIAWTIPQGSVAYLSISGVTATLYAASAARQGGLQINLATDGSGVRPTLGDIATWLSQALPYLLGSGDGVAVSLVDATTSALSALALVEGYTPAPQPIGRATALNYLQMRVMALLFDLMAADMASFFAQMLPATAQGMWLTWLGNFYGVPRTTQNPTTEESDDAYRRRMAHMLAQPQENNVAIASLLTEALGIGNIAVTDAGPGQATVWIYSPVDNPYSILPLARGVAAGGVGLTGMLYTTTNDQPARAGTFRAGELRAGDGGSFVVLH